MAAAVRKRGVSLSCSIQSEQDLLIKDEANFSATQALKEHEYELLSLDPERVRGYLDEKNLLKVNENKTLKDENKSKEDKMKYVLNETNCIKGTRGLQHILEMLRSLGNPTYMELANKIDTNYNKRMEEICRQYPRESQTVYVDRLRTQGSDSKMENQQQSLVPALAAQEEIVPTELKIIVLGDDSVGKTSLLIRYCIGMEKYNKKIPSVYYRDAVGALLVYDVTNPQSLTSLKQWWQDACDVVMKKDGQPIPAVILANKCDLATPGELEPCDELKCYKCFNTSAKRGEGITEAIECLLEDIIKGGLVKEGTECWTEIPVESVRIEQFQTVERVQNKTNCAC